MCARVQATAVHYLVFAGSGQLGAWPTSAIGEVRRYYHLGGQRVAMRVSGASPSSQNGVYYLHTDHLGSTSLVTTGEDRGGLVAGSVWLRQLYDPYGAVRYASTPHGPAPTDYGYTGQRATDLGLMDYRARWYIPALGRFASADTIAPGVGGQALNRYSYAGNNPLGFYDPTGHVKWKPPSLAPPSPFDKAVRWLGAALDSVSSGLGARLDFVSENVGWTLDCAAGYCHDRGWHPSNANAQAWGIVSDWLYETGPERQYFGPGDPFTQDVRNDAGVQMFLMEWENNGRPVPYPPGEEWWPYPIESTGGECGVSCAFVRENYELVVSTLGLGSMTPEGQIDAVGGVLGSYQVRVESWKRETVVLVYNETGWRSATRLGPYGSIIPNIPRSEWGPGGTIYEYFYWYPDRSVGNGFR